MKQGNCSLPVVVRGHAPKRPQKGGSAMRENLEVALRWLETAAAIISIVVPATRKVADMLTPSEPEENE